MAASLNLHKVFAGRAGYLDRLRVPDGDDIALRQARELIRGVLKTAFRDWNQHVSRTELFEGAMLKSLTDAKLPQPKFRLQGSFAYHTVNDCQVNPPQQIDQDDGVFLPIGFLSANGSARPGIASKAYFKLVEDALRPLCARNGWILNPGRAKDTCVRIQITPRTHIDLPLYAIRDEAFERLVETALNKSLARNMAFDAAADDLFDDVYRGLADTEIMLAHRAEGWIGSDPRKLEDWFNNAVQFYGPQVRRLARAFKAMRDAQWASSDLRSICIMAALVTALENIGAQEESRDDLALLNTAREMVRVFSAPIENPVFPGDASKCLCEGWTAEFRQQVRGLFQRAVNELDAAINGTMHKGVALDHAKNAFGPRVPTDTDLISSIGLVEIIRSVPPQPQPQPMPVRTKSG
jgi:hypothetical protein